MVLVVPGPGMVLCLNESRFFTWRNDLDRTYIVLVVPGPGTVLFLSDSFHQDENLD